MDFSFAPPWKSSLALMIAGAATTLAFAPFFYGWIIWLTIPYFMVVLRATTSTKHAMMRGWCYGFGYFIASTYWIANALLVDAARYALFIPIATAGLSAVLALYFALHGAVMWRYRELRIIPYSCLFAASWVMCELLRSFLFTGFPWNLLGYAWGATEVTLQAASIGGVWWLSTLTVLMASVPLWWRAGEKKASVFVLFGGLLLVGYGVWRLQQHPTAYHAGVQLRLVQAAIPQSLKWEDGYKIAAFKKHIALSKTPSRTPITHIIWPESAMTAPFREGEAVVNILQQIVPAQGALLTGVVRVDKDSTPRYPIIYNALQSLNAQGEIEAIYDKRMLVPFGEYMPLRAWIPFKKLTAGTIDFSEGTHAMPQQVTSAPPFRTLICYESIFPQLSHASYPAWMVNITNDAWFGDSAGPQQHFQMARMRAVEQGVPLVRAAGAGISAVVDAYGRILHSLPVGEVGVVDSGLPVSAISAPFYARYEWRILAVTLMLLGIIGQWQTIKKSLLHFRTK